MNWYKIIRKEFEDKNYQAIISILKQNINDNIDPLTSSIELIYIYYYIILEVNMPLYGKPWENWCNELKCIYDKYSQKWNENPIFLFYIAYISSCFCGGFIELKEKDIDYMFYKANELCPKNRLYEWGVFNRKEYEYKRNGNGVIWKEKNKKLAIIVLRDKSCIKDINKYPLVGQDLLWILSVYAKEND